MTARQEFGAWGVLWRSKNLLDGDRSYLLGRYYAKELPPVEFLGCERLLFSTRKAAKKFISDKFGYLRDRKDLRREPFGWKMPRAVKVSVSIGISQ